METVFANAYDRGFAARELSHFLVDDRGERHTLANVGAIARANVRLEAIERSRRLDAFSERRRVVREHAANAGSVPPESMPLFTPADLAALKPFLIVRTREMFQRQVLLFSLLYIVGFHLVALVWRLRGIQGDHLLLAVAHLLTALGFSILLSRPDPLRDIPLFVRYAEVTALGLMFMAALSLVDQDGRIPGAQLPAVDRGLIAVSAVDPVWFRTWKQHGQGESRPAAAHRSDPFAAGVVSRRLFHPPMGVAQGDSRRGDPESAIATLGQPASE